MEDGSPSVTARRVAAHRRATGKPAAIGALSDIDAMLAGTAGTRVVAGVTGVEFASS